MKVFFLFKPDTMENLDAEFTEEEQLIVDYRNKSHFQEIAKWANFLAIVGFVVLGLMIVASFFMIASALASRYASGQLAFVGVVYLFVAGLYFFPAYYLIRFARKTKSALRSNSQVDFNAGIINLKYMFKFFGIMTIVVLGIYALIFIVGLISGLSRF